MSCGGGVSEEAKKRMNLIGVLWVQALTGTNFDFSAYSSSLKQVWQISQVELNNLAVASDLGKVLGWISGYAMRLMPLWAVLFIATSMGLVGYGLQWLIITGRLASNYWQVYLCCLLAGNSICWLNTVGFVLGIRNFPTRKAMALGISTSYNALTPAVFTLIVKAISLERGTIYLLLNAVLPLIICAIVITSVQEIPSIENSIAERPIFVILNMIAIALGAYLLPIKFLSLKNTLSTLSYKIYAVGMLLLLLAPLCIPATVHVCGLRNKCNDDMGFQGYYSRIQDDNDSDNGGLGKNPGDNDNGGLGKEFYRRDEHIDLQENARVLVREGSDDKGSIRLNWAKRVPGLGEEHNTFQLLCSIDFWLCFFMYLCGASVGLAYSNNLGQIAVTGPFQFYHLCISILIIWFLRPSHISSP